MDVAGVGRSKRVYHSFPEHEHGYWEIMLNLSGCGRMVIGDGQYSFKPGDIFVIPPMTLHYKQSDGGFTDLCMFINNFRNIGQPGVKCFCDDTSGSVRRVMELALEFWDRDQVRHISAVNVMGDLIYQILACFYNQDQKQDLRLETVLEQMHVNLANPGFSLTEIVAACGYSQSYFRKLFKQSMGESPLSYFNHLRINHAKSLLQQYGTSRMIKDVAAACGFSDPLYFCRVFKKYEKISPTEYVQKLMVVDEQPIYMGQTLDGLDAGAR